jgi:hypothetical protein
MIQYKTFLEQSVAKAFGFAVILRTFAADLQTNSKQKSIN